MSLRGLSYYERHFFLTNRLIQLLFGLRPSQSLNKQLFFVFILTVFVFPAIVHQFYQLLTSDMTLQVTVKVLQKMLSGLCILYGYSTTYFSLVTMKFIIARFKDDYDQLSDENELNIFENYTKQSKLYTYVIIIFSYSYVFLNIFPYILNVFFYIFGKLDDKELTLPFPVNNVLKPGALYYSLLIYQVIIIFVLLTVGSLFISIYLIFVQHACTQLSVIILKIRQPFKRDHQYLESPWYCATPREEYDWIVDIVKRYTKATEFVELLNKFSNRTYIIVSFFAMVIVIFDFLYMFQLSEMLHNALETIDCCIIIVGTIVTLYLNFYVGQKLLDHGNAIFEELRQVPFNNFSVKTQKMLLFVIARSTKPCVLSIGGMFVSSHEVFSMLIQKALSFATVYYSIQ